jgi:hypothetical protein
VKVFLLWHIHEISEAEEDSKLLGVYSSHEKAEAARDRAVRLPGFRDSPDAFEIGCCEIDRDEWSEGFVTV